MMNTEHPVLPVIMGRSIVTGTSKTTPRKGGVSLQLGVDLGVRSRHEDVTVYDRTDSVLIAGVETPIRLCYDEKYNCIRDGVRRGARNVRGDPGMTRRGRAGETREMKESENRTERSGGP